MIRLYRSKSSSFGRTHKWPIHVPVHVHATYTRRKHSAHCNASAAHACECIYIAQCSFEASRSCKTTRKNTCIQERLCMEEIHPLSPIHRLFHSSRDTIQRLLYSRERAHFRRSLHDRAAARFRRQSARAQPRSKCTLPHNLMRVTPYYVSTHSNGK